MNMSVITDTAYGIFAGVCFRIERAVKKMRCFLRSVNSRIIKNVHWDGHCWDSLRIPGYVRCVDCGTIQYIEPTKGE